MAVLASPLTHTGPSTTGGPFADSLIDFPSRFQLPCERTLKGRTMKRTNYLCVLLLGVMLMPDVVMAQACPAITNLGSANLARVSGMGPTSFFGSVTSCSTQKEGGGYAPTNCNSGVVIGVFHFQAAYWSNTTARLSAASMSPSAGCRFYCGPGGSPAARNSCIVKAADGLPVELMGFGVE